MLLPLGLRITREECTGKRKLSNGVPYYFVKGVELCDNDVAIKALQLSELMNYLAQNHV